MGRSECLKKVSSRKLPTLTLKNADMCLGYKEIADRFKDMVTELEKDKETNGCM